MEFRDRGHGAGSRDAGNLAAIAFTVLVGAVSFSGSVVTFVAARVVDDQGQVVATASSTYLIKDRPE